MNPLGKVLAEDRRGIILRVLSDQGDYALNDGVLQDALERSGHRVSRDVVRGDLGWLSELELVAIEDVRGLWIASLTARGEDVARGRAVVAGIKRPSPRP